MHIKVSKLVSSLLKKDYVKVTINFQDKNREIITRKIMPLVKYDNPNELKMTNSIVDNDNTYGQYNTNTMVKSNKYINNNKKYNNYKNRQNNSFKSYHIENEQELYANKYWE